MLYAYEQLEYEPSDDGIYESIFIVSENQESAYLSEKKGKHVYQGEDRHQILSHMDDDFPANHFMLTRLMDIQTIPDPESGSQDSIGVLNEPIVNDQCTDLPTLVELFKSTLIDAYIKSSDWNRLALNVDPKEYHGLYCRECKENWRLRKIRYDLPAHNRQIRNPEYEERRKMINGKIPVSWFNAYGYLILKYLGMPFRYTCGWGTWDGARYNFLEAHSRIKHLGLLTNIRRQDWWYELVEEASHYIHGAITRRKDQWFFTWGKEMEKECNVLGITVPIYKKGKKNV